MISCSVGTGTGIIIIQRGGDGYHTTRTHGYPLTSLVATVSVPYLLQLGVLLVYKFLDIRLIFNSQNYLLKKKEKNQGVSWLLLHTGMSACQICLVYLRLHLLARVVCCVLLVLLILLTQATHKIQIL